MHPIVNSKALVVLIISISIHQASYSQQSDPPKYLLGLCTDALNGDVYGMGEFTSDDSPNNWAVLKGGDIIDTTIDSVTLSNRTNQVYCWMTPEEKMHFIWGHHGMDRPRNSTRVYHGIYDFEQGRWHEPEIIWEAPQGLSFDGNAYSTSFILEKDTNPYYAFKINEQRDDGTVLNRVGLVYKKSDQDDWQFKSFERFLLPSTSNGSVSIGLGVSPGFFIDNKGRYYLAFMYTDGFDTDGRPTPSVYLITSDDEGLTWNHAMRVVRTESSGEYRPRIWVTDSGIHLLWFESPREEDNRYAYTYSPGIGHRWESTQYIPIKPHRTGPSMCTDRWGRTHMVIGKLFGETLDYHVLENQKWQYATDVNTHISEPGFYGLIDPSLTCHEQAVVLHAQQLTLPDSGRINIEKMVHMRLDSIYTKVMYTY